MCARARKHLTLFESEAAVRPTEADAAATRKQAKATGIRITRVERYDVAAQG